VRDRKHHWVATFSSSVQFVRRAVVPVAAGAFFCAALFAATRSDEPSSDSVGVIDGEAITVSGPMNVEVVRGQTKTVLRSGSDVRVKSGTARIDLVEGGQITICGPAHLSVLKSGGSLTVALDTGTIHVHVEREPALTIYTPQIQAQTVSIGSGPQEALVGFDAAGAMCIRAIRGAVRIEQQLTGQSILVPQTGDVLLTNGQLDSVRSSDGRCSCELQVAKATPPPTEISRLATTDEIRPKSLDTKPNTSPAPVEILPVKEEPIYKVLMPPLVYDANAKIQPDFDPKMIILIRRVRVRSSLTFQGRVQGLEIAAAAPPPAPTPSVNSPNPTAHPTDSVWDRVRNLVRRFWSRGS
jgi:hypothetical protein